MFGLTLYDVVINLSYLLFLVGFSLKDILWLRIVIIIAASTDIIGRAWLAPEPLYSDIIWCAFDVAVNGYQLAIILRERSTLNFSDEEKLLHTMAFRNIPELQFRRLLNISTRQTLPNATTFVEQHSELNSLIVIYDGLAKVEVDGAVVNYMRNGNFVGEISFLTGNSTTASVTTLMPTSIFSWKKSDLKELMNKDSELHMMMHSVFSADLLLKLVNHTGGTTSNEHPVAREDNGEVCAPSG
ncbi:MAG: cyclic nucleotide-binding domain-containing protein [Geobacteraceae bacterium]|nr:cyclic nucleotide-binding domain-containing protein [Geobacteraceae bacterium]